LYGLFLCCTVRRARSFQRQSLIDDMRPEAFLTIYGAFLLLASPALGSYADSQFGSLLDARGLVKRIVTDQNATLAPVAGQGCDGPVQCLGDSKYLSDPPPLSDIHTNQYASSLVLCFRGVLPKKRLRSRRHRELRVWLVPGRLGLLWHRQLL
jgi:hypothetical protein